MPDRKSEELSYYFREYLESHKQMMDKIGSGIEILSKTHADHDLYSKECFAKTMEQHNNILGKLNDYHKLLIALIAVLAGLVGVKVLQGGGL